MEPGDEPLAGSGAAKALSSSGSESPRRSTVSTCCEAWRRFLTTLLSTDGLPRRAALAFDCKALTLNFPSIVCLVLCCDVAALSSAPVLLDGCKPRDPELRRSYPKLSEELLGAAGVLCLGQVMVGLPTTTGCCASRRDMAKIGAMRSS